ncbi:MAG: hypothetical protein K2F99_06150 [Muribaculaceae bacterium]|nr:hypothetical protein [Muribaculaceae bacterium]
MPISEGIGLCGCMIMSIGMISVLFYGFRVQDNIKKWKSEIDNRYVPELLRKKMPEKPAENNDEEKEVEKDPWWIRMWYK